MLLDCLHRFGSQVAQQQNQAQEFKAKHEQGVDSFTAEMQAKAGGGDARAPPNTSGLGGALGSGPGNGSMVPGDRASSLTQGLSGSLDLLGSGLWKTPMQGMDSLLQPQTTTTGHAAMAVAGGDEQGAKRARVDDAPPKS